MPPTLIACRALRYNARALSVGEEFSASARDARLLVALGRASMKRPAGASPAPQDGLAEVPAPAAPLILDAPAEPAKRKYKRRDLVAEEQLPALRLDTDAGAEPAAAPDPIQDATF